MTHLRGLCDGCQQSRHLTHQTETTRPLCQTCHDFDEDDAFLAAAWETGIERGEQWALDLDEYGPLGWV